MTTTTNKQVYVEKDCTFEFEGGKFESGGAVVTPDYCIGYIGDRREAGGPRELLDWHGNVLGTCSITSTWKTPHSYVSSRMHQVYATVNGVTYTGRSAGAGMVFKGKRAKRSKQ